MNGAAGGNLKSAVAKGFLWGGMGNAVCQLLNLFFGIFLARMLGPEDFGPIGMLAIFSAIAGSLQDSGFVAALANRKQVGNSDYNAVFWFNVISSVVMYALLFFAAPLIATFFEEPSLLWLSRYIFLGFVVAGFGIVPSAYLFRELKVKERSLATILSIVVSGATGIVMAANGYSYWGIATQSILYVFVRAAVCWFFTPWRPSLNFDFTPLRELFSFSYRLLVTNLFTRINANVISLILGKFYRDADVGNYVKAAEWNTMGSETVNGMVNGLAQPVLAKIVDDGERQLRVFRKMLRFTAFVSFPLLFGLSLVAPELIVVTITEKWLQSAFMLQYLAVWGAFLPLQSMFSNLLVSRGCSCVYMWITVLQGVFVLLLLVLLYPYGIDTMIIAYSLFNILWIFVWHYFVKKEIGITIRMFLGDTLPFALLAASVMGVAFLLTKEILTPHLLLLSRMALAALLYVGLLFALGNGELKEMLLFLYSKNGKKNES